MIVFESYIFQVNPQSSETLRTIKNRPSLIGIILILLGFLFYLFEMFNLSTIPILLGCIIIGLDRFSLLTSRKKIGNLTKKLIINNTEVIIDNIKLNITALDYLKINLESFESQLKSDTYKLWKSNGKDNLIEISFNGNISITHFWIPSFEHVKKLRNIEFPENVFLSDNINH